MRKTNLIREGEIDEIRHAHSPAFPLVVKFKDVRQPGISGSRVGKHAAHRNGIVQLLKDEFVREPAWIPYGQGVTRLE